MTDTTTHKDWRRELDRLAPLALPLLPCGAGAEGKGPIDARTGNGLSRWQIARFTVAEIAAMNGVVRSVGSRTGEGLLCFDIDGATALELALGQGCDPQQAQTWQVHRDTDPCRLKVLWRLSDEQQAELGAECTSKAHTQAPRRPGEKGEAIELFHHPRRQVLLLGQHVPSQGHYVWPDGMGPEALAPITPAWWALAKRIAAKELGQQQQQQTGTGTGTTRSKGSSNSKEWRPADPCPICGRRSGRDRAGSFCSRNRNSGGIRCFHGSTFSPELSHGVLKVGETVAGTDGVVYGFCGTQDQDGHLFSKFVVHQEREPRAPRHDSPAVLRAELQDGEAQEPQQDGPTLQRHEKRHTLAPDEVLQTLPLRMGLFRLNVRTGDVHTRDGVLSGNQIGRLYLKLSNPAERWPKDSTADAVMHLAHENPFDPVQEWLEGLEAEPLPMEQWQRLDHHLLGIDDPIAATFLPRFFISAIARTMEPGCYVRQTPVLIGPQERGKTELGRILFGADQWVEGVGALDRDALQRAGMAWGVELAELDGVTRRRDQEQLKAFLTECIDTYQIRYDRCPEKHPRRFVFWGTANRPPLRDATGSTRFVCIPIPDRNLPLEWARQNRAALWARALEQYRAGVTWLRTSEDERQQTEARNAEFIQEDPWAEKVGRFLQLQQAGDQLPVTVHQILEHLSVPIAQQNNQYAERARQIAESLGWSHGRRRWRGAAPRQGLWPPDPVHPTVHPVHPGVHPPCTPAEPAPEQASDPAVHPVHPISVKVSGVEGRSARPPAVTASDPGDQPESRQSVGDLGCTGCTPHQTPVPDSDLGVHGGVHAGVHGGVHTPAECAPAIQNSRIACWVDGEGGWTRPAELRGASVFVTHADGRQLLAGRDQISDQPPAPQPDEFDEFDEFAA